jgi:hypothetical protein
MSTKMSVEGELELVSYVVETGAPAGTVQLGARWLRISGASGDALGRDLPGLAAELLPARVVVTLEPSGRVRELGFSKDTSPLARLALRSLILELTAELAAASTGSVGVVDTGSGRARVARSVDGGTAITTRLQYDDLDAFPLGLDESDTHVSATGSVVMDGAHPAEVRSHEELHVREAQGPVSDYQGVTDLSAKLLRRSQEAAVTAPPWVSAGVRGTTDAGYDRNASLERRSLGVNEASLLADVRAASLQQRAAPTEWIWRDAAYLELHPEACAKLLDAAATMGLPALAAAFDISVIAGGEIAQTALIGALRRVAANEELYIVLVQRLAFLQSPSVDMLAFVGSEYTRLSATDRGFAAAYTLGALSARVRIKDSLMAAQVRAPIERGLRSARSTTERAALIAALGNAGAPGELVRAYKASADADVRRAVAHALRRIDERANIPVLLELLSDKEPSVSTMAAASFLRQTLSEEDWTSLAHDITAGTVPKETHGVLASGIARRNDRSGLPVFVALMERADVGEDIKQRVQSILQGAP